MAGKVTKTEEGPKRDPDILFDLTPEDDKSLQESDLLNLVNFGQLNKPVEVLGYDGSTCLIQMALLWDDDYIKLLKATTKYAADPVLRSRLIRRLRLHSSIQEIDGVVYNDPDDPKAQRLLWAMLCRLSDAQMDLLDGEYGKMELDRNSSVVNAVNKILEGFNETAPEAAKVKEASDIPESVLEAPDEPTEKVPEPDSETDSKQSPSADAPSIDTPSVVQTENKIVSASQNSDSNKGEGS